MNYSQLLRARFFGEFTIGDIVTVRCRAMHCYAVFLYLNATMLIHLS